MQSCLFKLDGHWAAAMQPCCPKRLRANHGIYLGRYFRAWSIAQEFAAHMAGDWATRRGATPFPEAIRGEKVCLSYCVISRRRVTPFGQPQGRPGREGPAAPEGRSPVRLESLSTPKAGKHGGVGSWVPQGPSISPKSLSRGCTAERPRQG